MDFPIVEIKDLDKRLKKLYERGQEAASQKNIPYALEMYRDILRKQPGALGVRTQMRQLQFERINRQAKFGNQFLACLVALPWYFMNLYLHQKGDEASQIKAMDNAERMMAIDCTAYLPLMMVDRAGLELELPEISIDVLLWALQFYPKSQLFWDRLGQAYADAGQGTKSLAVYKKLMELSPNNKSYQSKYKDAQAEAALEPWAPIERGEGTFLDVVKDKEAAARLEQSGHTLRTPEGLRLLIDALLVSIAELDTVDKRRQLADHYAELHDWDNAAEQYQKVIDMSGVVDPAIEQAIIGVRIRKHDQKIQELEKAFGKEENADRREELEAQIKEARAEKVSALLEALQERVMKFPNQYQDRMELAKMLIDKGAVDEALGHLQKLQSHPQVGAVAALHLGRCFYIKRVYDLAVEQYTRVINDIRNMTPAKKEAYYELAKAYEAMGKHEDAVTCYKTIYASDMHYKDVSQIIEGLYKE